MIRSCVWHLLTYTCPGTFNAFFLNKNGNKIRRNTFPTLFTLMCVLTRPYQHAGDMVAAISLTLKQCNRPDLATPAALVLQGLQELCRAEVPRLSPFVSLNSGIIIFLDHNFWIFSKVLVLKQIFLSQVVDIISAWRTVWPELSCHSQPEVVQAIAELLALVPQLTVKSEQYEVRRNVHVALCWEANRATQELHQVMFFSVVLSVNRTLTSCLYNLTVESHLYITVFGS